MKTIALKLALAAALAALAPAAATACEPTPPVIRVHHVASPPQAFEHRAPPPAWRHERPVGHGWRAHERAELRAEYARLDRARAGFYASPHRPWRVRQFETWYARERRELDARWARIS